MLDILDDTVGSEAFFVSAGFDWLIADFIASIFAAAKWGIGIPPILLTVYH